MKKVENVIKVLGLVAGLLTAIVKVLQDYDFEGKEGTGQEA